MTERPFSTEGRSMDVFLTSTAWKVLPRLVPLLPAPPARCRVAFVPTASHHYEERPWVDQDRAALVEAGFHVADLELAEHDAAGVRAALESADLVFVAGENTFVLLHEAIRSGFRDVAPGLVREGLIYVGSSAGSLLAGPRIDPARFGDDPNEAPELTDHAGLGLVDVVPVVHFGHEASRDDNLRLLDHYYDRGLFLVPLTDRQFLHARDGSFRLYENSRGA
jgi:dipeptidase E